MEPYSFEVTVASIPDGKMAPVGVVLPLFRARKLAQQFTILGIVNVLICLSTQFTMSSDPDDYDPFRKRSQYEYDPPEPSGYDIPDEQDWASAPEPSESSDPGPFTVDPNATTSYLNPNFENYKEFVLGVSQGLFMDFVDLLRYNVNKHDLFHLCVYEGVQCVFGFNKVKRNLDLAFDYNGEHFHVPYPSFQNENSERKFDQVVAEIEQCYPLDGPVKFTTKLLHIVDVIENPEEWMSTGRRMYTTSDYMREISKSFNWGYHSTSENRQVIVTFGWPGPKKEPILREYEDDRVELQVRNKVAVLIQEKNVTLILKHLLNAQ